MGILEIILIGIGLAMDAFAVSICKGLSMKQMSWKKAIKISLYFSLFQAAMPAIGFLLGTTFSDTVERFDHWVAFILLLIIGINMIKDSFDNEIKKENDSTDAKTMILLAIATSIDALAVGITFSFFEINIILALFIIGTITYILCNVGVKIGNKFGSKFQSQAQITGGVILILIGLKILLEHLGFFIFTA